MLGGAANLMVFLAGRPGSALPPIIAAGAESLPAAAANPLPQALVLTAIVIGFALLCFALVLIANLARHLKVDPEAALRSANAKFTRRFRHIEATLVARGSSPAAASLEEMEALWQDAKAKGIK